MLRCSPFARTANVWVANNGDMPDQGFKEVPEPVLTTALRRQRHGGLLWHGKAGPV
jgi:hypothetical protein